MSMPVPSPLAARPAWPGWLMDMMRGSTRRLMAGSVSGLTVSVFVSKHYRLVRACVPDAAVLDDADFQQATIVAYGDIASELGSSGACHAVRLWNYIPDIHRCGSDGIDRYMVFNKGRYEACRRWLGTDDFHRGLPTASGIGHRGRDLIVDALAANEPGESIENPRQISAYKYSRRYGPRPPCFARATKIPGHLLVGGTASVRGEASLHQDDLNAQIEETFANLNSLLLAAGCPTRHFSDLRVYHSRPENGLTVGQLVRERVGVQTRIECLCADLCRKELLVEIEGVVNMNGSEPSTCPNLKKPAMSW